MYTCSLLFKFLFVNAFIVLSIKFFSVNGNLKGLRIFQGRDAKRGEFPYVVSLSVKISYTKNITSERFRTFCTGSIVTPIWVLTAGHCIPTIQTYINPPNNTGKNTVIVRPVIRYVSPADNYKWITSNIIKIILNPGYKSRERIIENDIALVEVQDTKMTTLGKISAIPFSTMYGHKVFSLGFGLMKSESGQIAPALSLNKTLQVFDAIVVRCGLNYRSSVLPSFCLAWNCQNPTLTCPGDSGGPVIHPSGIVGVATASQIRYCNTTENLQTPLIATPVSPYVDWIARSIRGT